MSKLNKTDLDFLNYFTKGDYETVRMDINLLKQGFKFMYVTDTIDVSTYFTMPYDILGDKEPENINEEDYLRFKEKVKNDNKLLNFLWINDIFFSQRNGLFSWKVILDEYKGELMGLNNYLLEHKIGKFLLQDLNFEEDLYSRDQTKYSLLKFLYLISQFGDKNSLSAFNKYYNDYLSVYNLKKIEDVKDIPLNYVQKTFQKAKLGNVINNTFLEKYVKVDQNNINTQIDRRKYLFNSYTDMKAINRILKVNRSFLEGGQKLVVLYVSQAPKSLKFFEKQSDLFYNQLIPFQNFNSANNTITQRYNIHRNDRQLLLLYALHKDLENKVIDQIFVEQFFKYAIRSSEANDENFNNETFSIYLQKIVSNFKDNQLSNNIDRLDKVFIREQNYPKILESIAQLKIAFKEISEKHKKDTEQFKNDIETHKNNLKHSNILHEANVRFMPYVKTPLDVVWNPFHNIPTLFILAGEKEEIRNNFNVFLYKIITINKNSSYDEYEKKGFIDMIKYLLKKSPKAHTKALLRAYIFMFTYSGVADDNEENRKFRDEEALSYLQKFDLSNLASEIGMNDSDLLYFQAWIFRRLGKYADAIQICNKILSENKKDFRFLHGRALAYCSQYYDKKLRECLLNSLSDFKTCLDILEQNNGGDYDLNLFKLTKASINNSIADMLLRKGITENKISKQLLDEINVYLDNLEALTGNELFMTNSSFVHSRLEYYYEYAQLYLLQYKSHFEVKDLKEAENLSVSAIRLLTETKSSSSTELVLHSQFEGIKNSLNVQYEEIKQFISKH